MNIKTYFITIITIIIDVHAVFELEWQPLIGGHTLA